MTFDLWDWIISQEVESIGLSCIGVSYRIGEVGYQAIILVSSLFPASDTKSTFEGETHTHTHMDNDSFQLGLNYCIIFEWPDDLCLI